MQCECNCLINLKRQQNCSCPSVLVQKAVDDFIIPGNFVFYCKDTEPDAGAAMNSSSLNMQA
jgi:hypothetical protein